MRMMGRSGSRRWRSFRNWRPSLPGRLTSSRTRSNGRSSIYLRAVSASGAALTSNPSAPRSNSSPSRISASSSMTRTFPLDTGCFRFPRYRELQAEGCAATRCAGDINLAAVFADNAVAYRQPEPGAAEVGLGGKERIENLVQVVPPDAHAAIVDLDFDDRIAGHGPNLEHAAIGHGIFGVQEKVQKDLLELAVVAVDGRQFRLQILEHADAAGLELVIEQQEGIFDHPVEVDFGELRARGAGEAEQVIDDLRSAEGLLDDLFNQLQPRVVAIHLLGQHLDVVGNHRQRGIDLVGHARSQQADGGQLFRLHQLLLEADALGDVIQDDQEAFHLAGLVGES